MTIINIKPKQQKVQLPLYLSIFLNLGEPYYLVFAAAQFLATSSQLTTSQIAAK